ncbi:MAG TPA: hypothetical protein VFO20_04745 [Propionibacteriaceae bacterium]|nr:hypothetical protein [Propionibacteriaceae bacterium]
MHILVKTTGCRLPGQHLHCGKSSEGGPDADIGQDPRTIGSWITSPACGYAAPRHLGPWYHYYLDRYPAGQISAVDLPGSVPGWPRPMTLTPARVRVYAAQA